MLSSLDSCQLVNMPWNKLAFQIFQNSGLKPITMITCPIVTTVIHPYNSRGHHGGLAEGLGWLGMLLGAHGLHRVGEIEDTGAGLAALLGALTSGAVLAGEYTPSCPSEPFLSFPLLELLGSGCPVCEKTCRTIIELSISPHCNLFPFAAPLCDYAVYFTTFCAR